MTQVFSESGPIIKQIARDRGITLPAIEGVKQADEIARQIVQVIYHPVAELYTHSGAQDFVVLSARNREEAERHQLPVVLGERAVYEKHRSRP